MPPRTTPQVEGSQPPLIVREDVQFFQASFVPGEEAGSVAEPLEEAYVPGALIEAETSAWAQRAAAEIRVAEDEMIIAILNQCAVGEAVEEAAIPRRTFWQHLLDEED